jgi:hypothetical protein
MTVALGLALGTPAATARECQRETPLPADARLIAPGAEVPEAVARFAGVWTGTLAGLEGSDAPCHTLVVEEVFANGYARVIVSLGTAATLDLQVPLFLRATGRIVNGELRFLLPLPTPDRPNFTYRFVGEALEGLTRVTDLHQVGCGPPADGPPLAPPTTGPRDRLTAKALLATAAVGTGPVHNAYFLPVGQAAPALHSFQGTLTIQASTMSRTRHGCAGLPAPLPAFTVAFFTQGEHLVPVVRDIVDPPGIILSPGRVWSEPDDGGMSRAAFPFVLTAAHDGWERVTFADALNMATGIGEQWPRREPSLPFADVNTQLGPFNKVPTAREKLAIAFSLGQYPWGPGEVLRYNNMHTFVLAAAMDSFLKRQAGAHVQLWDMVVAEVFRPLGIFAVPTLHTQEADGGRGIPYLRSGLYITIDDLAKLTTLLQQGGRHQGQQLLSATKLAEALYQTDARGLPSGHKNRFGEGRYHLSFWSVPYRTATGCFFQIPYMSGNGGNVVVLLPNGISAFRFADGHNYDVDTIVRAGETLRPFPCPAGSAATPPPVRRPLTASALRAEVPGNTFYRDPVHIFPVVFGGRLTMFVSADGGLYGTFKGEPAASTEDDIGRWHITPEGQFCRTWHMWDNRREPCYTVSWEGEHFELAMQDRFVKEVYTRMLGNPEGY